MNSALSKLLCSNNKKVLVNQAGVPRPIKKSRKKKPTKMLAKVKITKTVNVL